MRVGPYLIREVSFWRSLLSQVAEDLDRGADRERDGERKKWLRARACRIRKRLDEGVPDGWKMPPSDEFGPPPAAGRGAAREPERRGRPG